MSGKTKRLGDLLIEAGLIEQEQLEKALELQKVTFKKLGEILIDEGFVKESQIIEVLEFQLGIPHLDLEKYFINPEMPRLISEKLARRHMLIPVKKERDNLIVAMSDPLNIFAVDDIKIATGLEVIPAISTRQNIENAINRYYGSESAENAIEEFKREYRMPDLDDLEAQDALDISNAPMVRLVNSFIKQAVRLNASDIHLEPYEKTLRLRFRIDGDLQEIMSIAKSAHQAIISRIKILGRMDIAEKRIPQDGRVEMVIDSGDIDMRISILPTVYGEKAVIRLLDRSSVVISKDQLGFTQDNLKIFDEIIKSPHGIILVTGPTGSGKTTTLYAALKELNNVVRNIITIEDPVEYRLEGVNQVQVSNKAGLTFASGLKAILRQDPDIVMVGEIRDGETAHIAVRAAITGHLVLSTMHTNDTASTVTRFTDMGIESYLVSSSVIGVVAQRLIKKICPYCKESYYSTSVDKKILDIEENVLLHRGKGCNICNYTGYKGRQAVQEIMRIDETIRALIDERASIDKIRKKALENGMTSLKENCKQLIFQGVTTVEELARIAYGLE
ncbi:Flp pilus assembly complex ATPase component TadA [Alkaliphilus sp. MSJ-5]|uniref:Flp pilus assembly complex ATPase component TadA n=1 Tax=Alkaliphilus flagellatus TaxID=2841507 RepID=A0ABS6G5D7_9FIRM|nr:ATPase, T2SS/T4P/T4SS family [Alkaliphilus flagellatus]MBU5677594.1 Flp pilus assembly complex ATPase component TadA [Alkaliphilus flagellatus]